jgi:hypothetical protein
MNVTALQVVGALGAVLGSGIVLYLVVRIDLLTSAATATQAPLPNAHTGRARPVLTQKAA